MDMWEESRAQALIQKSRHHDVRILRSTTKNVLSSGLDPKFPVFDRSFRYRDYRGLAHFYECDREFTEKLDTRETCPQPTKKLVDDWVDSCHCYQKSVSFLLECLLELERFDLLEDVHLYIEEDIAAEEARQWEQQRVEAAQRIQDPYVSTTSPTGAEFNPEVERNCSEDVVTRGDIRSYDAFVSYAPEDIGFVKMLIKHMEGERNCRLMVQDRDLLPGTSTYTVTADIIEKYCVRVIIVLSKAFLKSPACDFQVKFAHCLSPGSRSKRLIPVLIDDSFPRNDVPSVLRHVTMCDFTKKEIQGWFWTRLGESVKQSKRSESDVQHPMDLANTIYESRSKVPIDFSDVSPKSPAESETSIASDSSQLPSPGVPYITSGRNFQSSSSSTGASPPPSTPYFLSCSPGQYPPAKNYSPRPSMPSFSTCSSGQYLPAENYSPRPMSRSFVPPSPVPHVSKHTNPRSPSPMPPRVTSGMPSPMDTRGRAGSSSPMSTHHFGTKKPSTPLSLSFPSDLQAASGGARPRGPTHKPPNVAHTQPVYTAGTWAASVEAALPAQRRTNSVPDIGQNTSAPRTLHTAPVSTSNTTEKISMSTKIKNIFSRKKKPKKPDDMDTSD